MDGKRMISLDSLRRRRIRISGQSEGWRRCLLISSVEIVWVIMICERALGGPIIITAVNEASRDSADEASRGRTLSFSLDTSSITLGDVAGSVPGQLSPPA